MIKLPTLVQPARKASKQPKPLKYPKRQELAYTSELVTISRNTADLIDDRIIPRLPALTQQADRSAPVARTDATDRDLDALFESVYDTLGLNDKAQAVATGMIATVQSAHAKAFADTYVGVIPVNPMVGAEPWLLDQMRLTQSANTKLIKSIPETLLGDVEGIVSRGIQAGTRVEDIAAQIKARYPVSDSKATLIARDQVGKWFGNLSRLRQQDAGVTEYEWSTANDERVRPAHQARHGKVFRWDQPPPDGHPGQPVQCRCQAIAVIPEEPAEPVPAPAPKPRAPRRKAPAPTPVAAPVPVAAPKPPAPPSQPAFPVEYGKPAPGYVEARAAYSRALAGARKTMTLVGDRYEGTLPPAMRTAASALGRHVQQTLGLKRTRSIVAYAPLEAKYSEKRAWGIMGWDGTMKVRVAANSAHDAVLAGDVVTHETIHTLGGTEKAAYRGVAAHLEEISTEELTQSLAGSVTAYDGQKYTVAGAYSDLRTRMLEIISQATGETDPQAVTMRLRKAAQRFKSKAYSDETQAIDAMIDALEPATNTQRNVYARKIFDERTWK